MSKSTFCHKGQGIGMMFSQSVEKHDKGCHKGEDVVVGSNTLYVSDTVSITRYPLFNKCWPIET